MAVWEDPTLDEWDPNDFRIFCGDLGNDVNDAIHWPGPLQSIRPTPRNKATQRHLKNVYASLALATLSAALGAFVFFFSHNSEL
ncbi:hypothetical protein EMCRGX_G029971 [Ephydatia muelleri]